MFETNFTYTSSAPLAPSVHPSAALPILHDFTTIIHFNPDTRGCRRLSPSTEDTPLNTPIKYEVEDNIAFIPKKLWSGGVRYNAIFTALADGCDILIEAPGGFTSMNHWRLVRVGSSNEEGQATWCVEIRSEARCSKTFAGIVKGFIKSSHAQQQKAFKEKVEARPGMVRRRSSWPLEG